MITAKDFEALPPFHRGYAVCMFGNRDDQPHVPNESNPYPEHSVEWLEWNRGQTAAGIIMQDAEE